MVGHEDGELVTTPTTASDALHFRVRCALVTGGTRGIGLAVSRRLARAGVRVIALSNDSSQVAAFRSAMGPGLPAEAIQGDVRDRRALGLIVERLGEIDVLVANAGVNVRSPFLEAAAGGIEEMIDTNVRGVINSCQAVGPIVTRQPGGRVVVTSSLSATHAMRLRAVYSATKAAVSGLVRALAVEWGEFGTTVNAVGPGVVRTPLTEQYMQEHPERVSAFVSNTPLGRVGEPEDVAGAVMFLVSDEAQFITGQTLVVDGGVSAGSSWW